MHASLEHGELYDLLMNSPFGPNAKSFAIQLVVLIVAILIFAPLIASYSDWECRTFDWCTNEERQRLSQQPAPALTQTPPTVPSQ